MFANLRARVSLAVVVLLVAILAVPSLVSAGGWAVVTLDQLPGNVTAGQPYELGFMVRQHGRTPWEVKEIRIVAEQVDTGQTATFVATPDGQPGHYRADLVFPEAGRWEWAIESGLFPDLQPMPVLEVAAGTAASGAATAISSAVRIPDIPVGLLSAFALLAFAAGMVLIVRSRGKMLPRLAGGGLMVLCAGLVFVSFSAANAQAGRVQPVPVTAPEAETGQQLFLAKGCVVCHINERAMKNSAEFGVNVGPNLSVYRNDPDYLHAFLKDPTEFKKGSEKEIGMPDLGLKLVEIEALISFLNDEALK